MVPRCAQQRRRCVAVRRCRRGGAVDRRRLRRQAVPGVAGGGRRGRLVPARAPQGPRPRPGPPVPGEHRHRRPRRRSGAGGRGRGRLRRPGHARDRRAPAPARPFAVGAHTVANARLDGAVRDRRRARLRDRRLGRHRRLRTANRPVLCGHDRALVGAQRVRGARDRRTRAAPARSPAHPAPGAVAAGRGAPRTGRGGRRLGGRRPRRSAERPSPVVPARRGDRLGGDPVPTHRRRLPRPARRRDDDLAHPAGPRSPASHRCGPRRSSPRCSSARRW